MVFEVIKCPFILYSYDIVECIFDEMTIALMEMLCPAGVEIEKIEVIDEINTRLILEPMIAECERGIQGRPFLVKLTFQLDGNGSLRNMPLNFISECLRSFMNNYTFTTFGIYFFTLISTDIADTFVAIKKNDGEDERYIELDENDLLSRDSLELLYSLIYDINRIDDSVLHLYARHLLLNTDEVVQGEDETVYCLDRMSYISDRERIIRHRTDRYGDYVS